MTPGNPFSINVSLNATHEDSTVTTDSNIFLPAVNKIVTKGMHREKFWINVTGRAIWTSTT